MERLAGLPTIDATTESLTQHTRDEGELARAADHVDAGLRAAAPSSH